MSTEVTHVNVGEKLHDNLLNEYHEGVGASDGLFFDYTSISGPNFIAGYKDPTPAQIALQNHAPIKVSMAKMESLLWFTLEMEGFANFDCPYVSAPRIDV